MNKYQKVVMLAAIIAIVFMGIYPPWKMTLEAIGTTGTIKIERFWRYSYFFGPPQLPQNGDDIRTFDYYFGDYLIYSLLAIDTLQIPKDKGFRYRHIFEPRLDYMRLLFQWIFVVLIITGLVLILQNNIPKSTR